MKILFISHKFYPDIGGIEVNSEILATAFYNSGHEVRLMTWTSDTGDKKFPFPVIRHPKTSFILKEHKNAEVIFENNPSLRLAWPAIFLKKTHVVALRTWINRIEGGLGWQDKLKLQWLKRVSAVIAVSDAVRKRCWPDAIVIGNPYRNHLFKINTSLSDRTSDFVFIGRLVSDKGADIAIKALSILNKGGKKYTLTVIGSGPDLEQLKAMVNELNLINQVTFTGALSGEKLVSCLNQHHYLLVPSVWEEPFGNVALEGMACGCLPIVSDGGGLPDAVGNAGLVVKRGDPEALAQGIASLLNNAELEEKLRNAAPAHLINHYPEAVSRRYLDVVEQAFAQKR